MKHLLAAQTALRKFIALRWPDASEESRARLRLLEKNMDEQVRKAAMQDREQKEALA